ncbi:hypothetical protein D9757_000075 [Collybiopsis confluens]|uniref:ubiquitinyl hydrolase 1 n=1 Tax=Collybiopsis confluens TaxID=2823264 RepID=A0A8H5I296_9AGAR|nr:hypothetical protein D9757_000075 [Collybiopsis confluens]
MDLVGGPFAVIESDPGVFTCLIRKLGVAKLSLVELYDIEPWAIDHLKPHGLIFCFNWRDDLHQQTSEFESPEKVWFANQLSADACGTFALLNVLLNCPAVKLGRRLEEFRDETKEMSGVMKGLAVANSTFIRDAHNSFARPADLRGSLNTIASATLDAKKAKAKAAKQASQKPRKTKATKAKPKRETDGAADVNDSAPGNLEETYHFTSFVPFAGKVWELDGLRIFPLEVGELPSEHTADGWLDVVRPALRLKMEKYGGGASEDAANIRFSLLAIVDGAYETAHDEWYWWVKERQTIENQLEKNPYMDWKSQVDPELLVLADQAFTTDSPGYRLLSTGAQRMERDVEIMRSPPNALPRLWEDAVRSALRTKVGVEDEIRRATDDWTDHIKRTHDYEPFIREYISTLHAEGLLDSFLEIEKMEKRTAKKAKNNKGQAKPTVYREIEEEDEVSDAGEDGSDDGWRPSSRRK